MAYAEPAYRLDTYPDFDAPAQRAGGVRAKRTGGSAAAEQSSQLLVTAAKMVAIVLVVIAVLAFGRIALTNATVTTMIQSDTISGQIESARSSGVGLEMEQSVLSNTYAVDAAAQRLGMAAPSRVGTIALAPDVVAVDAEGALSLSASVKNLAGIQA